jgi:putative thiamine transport system substrate-binding protein
MNNTIQDSQSMIVTRRLLGTLVFGAGLAASLFAGIAAPARAADPDPTDWSAVEGAASGQTVYWNAWGGEPRINDYIAWTAREVQARFGVRLVHVKLADTAEAVSRVLAEKAAGTVAGGAIDLIWLNGENFAAMKREGLLFGPWAESLPNFALTDPDTNPAVRADFSVPTDGLESPWGKAQLVFFHDTAVLTDPPRDMGALLRWAQANPGRFTYPQPPDFLGSTFLKQALLDLSGDRAPLEHPVEEADFDAVTAPLWSWLDALHPHLWRQARAFPRNSADKRRLFSDGETDIGFAFNPAEPSAAIANGEVPDTVRSFVLDGGTIGNIHFVAIPFNAAHRAGAMVIANLILDPEVQAHAQDPAILGFQTVLDLQALTPEDRARFDALELGVATLSPADLGPVLLEPHASWMTRIAQDWTSRYGVAQ